MLINKIFHLREPVAEARKRLCELQTWNGAESDADVNCSLIETEGIGHFELSTRQGQRVTADFQEAPCDDPNRILFCSKGGNLEVAGIFELFPIRPNLTEVVLTLEYEEASAVQKAFAALDRFLNRQLARMEHCIGRARSARGGNGTPAVA